MLPPARGLAYASGALLLLSGVSGSLGGLGGVLDAASLHPSMGEFAGAARHALGVVAALGGVSVLAGGFLAGRTPRAVPAVLIGLGSGAGLLEFLARLALAWAVAPRGPLPPELGVSATLAGVGTLLALAAQARLWWR
ncbi:MAG TPA: hypothetical protein VM681_05215 [Candidatus Thermoplasmatota archaeon]|nr:hypothetical protein [Candidatus Thermoplasmatota archaeon]